MGPQLGPDLLRAAVEQASDAIVALDEQRRVLFANAAACELFGCALSDLIGMALAPPWSDVVAGGSGRVVGVRLAGGARAFDVIREQVHAAQLVIFRDTTSNAARDTTHRQLLLDCTPDPVLFVASGGRIVDANRAAERAFRYSREDLLARRAQDLELAAEASELDAALARALGGATVTLSLSQRRRDGSIFPAQVALRSARVGSETVGVMVIRDMSEQAELREHLVEAERLATFGKVAGGIAHELNNPLAYVLANAEVIARTLPRLSAQARSAAMGGGAAARVESELVDGISKCHDMLGVAVEGLERVRAIVSDLKTFSRRDPEEGVLVDINQLIGAALGLGHAELQRRARIEKALGGPPPVRGSTSGLSQMFLILVLGACQAIPETQRDQGTVRVSTFTGADGWAVAEIVDNGIAIPPDEKQRLLFDPIYATRARTRSGLGLYIARTVVEAHGGRLSIGSVDGVGNTVQVHLPPYDPDRKLGSSKPVRRITPGKRVLVVDDESSIVLAFRAILEPPYEVATAGSMAEALTRLRQDAEFDALLCDVMMPDGTGMDLFDRVKADYPRLVSRFLLMTGGVLDATTRERVAKSGLVCLEKPLSASELASAIEQVMSLSSS